MLLGNVHVALLKVLLSDVEKELSVGGFVPRMSKYCMFLGLLQSVSLKFSGQSHDDNSQFEAVLGNLVL